MKNTAIAYIRVSSEEQVKNYSLANQKEYCEKYARENDLDLVKIFKEEGKSAMNIDRPALISLLEYCRKNTGKVDYLVLYKIDRLSRSTIDYLEIKRRLAKYGVQVKSVTEFTDDTPMGEFMETLIAAQAKLDNAIRAERVSDGIRKRVESGLPVSVPPIGYKLSKGNNGKSITIPDEPTFSLLQRAGYQYLTGNYTFTELAELLNKWGFTTKKGNPATSNFVGKFLRMSFYKGIIYSKKWKKEYRGMHIPMFTDNEWDDIQDIVDGNPLTIKKKQRAEEFPLRGFVTCSVTGDPLTGSWCKGNTKHYAYYYSPSKYKSIPKDTLESEFTALLDLIEPAPGVIESFSRVLFDKYNEKYSKLLQNEQLLSDQIKDINGVGNEVEDDLAVKNLIKNENKINMITIETARNFSEHFLEHISQYWRTAHLRDKVKIQEVLFPQGLTYTYPEFLEPRISCLYKINTEKSTLNHLLVRAVRIELTTPWLKARCSTTELRPLDKLINCYKNMEEVQYF